MNNYSLYANYAFQASIDDVERAKTTKAPRGSYLYTIKEPKTNFRWPNWLEFETWKRDVEEFEGIRFVIKERVEGGLNYSQNIKMVCSRGQTGGKKQYEKRDKPRESKPSRKVSSQTALFPGTI